MFVVDVIRVRRVEASRFASRLVLSQAWTFKSSLVRLCECESEGSKSGGWSFNSTRAARHAICNKHRRDRESEQSTC